MYDQNRVTCEFCGVTNPVSTKTCLACRARLPQVVRREQNPLVTAPKTGTQTYNELLKKGKDIDDIYCKGLHIYSIFWRTIAEALVIALCSFAIGLTGGATGTAEWGVLCGVLVGFAVGWSIKISFLTLLITPLGIVVGTLLGILLLVLGVDDGVFVFTLSLCTLLATLIGSRRYPFRFRRLWEKLRPFIGLLGGLAFALLGLAVGIGLRQAVLTLLG